MLEVGLEPTIPVFERAKTPHAAVIGKVLYTAAKKRLELLWIFSRADHVAVCNFGERFCHHFVVRTKP
jgi:hypothetical protein